MHNTWIEGFYRNVLHEQRYLLILDGLKTTAVISIWALLLGTVLGILICRLRLARSPWLALPARAFIAVMRGVPLLVILMINFYVVFAAVNIDAVHVAILTFGVNFAAYVAEIYRAGIASVDRGQTEAGLALGFTRIQTFTHIVAPQALRYILPVYKGEAISMIKMTSVVGYIAVQDLTRAADIIRSRTFDAFFPLIMVAILYFLFAWLLLAGLTGLEARLSAGRPVRRR